MRRENSSYLSRRPRNSWSWGRFLTALLPRLEVLEDRTLPSGNGLADLQSLVKGGEQTLSPSLLNLVDPINLQAGRAPGTVGLDEQATPQVGVPRDLMVFDPQGRVGVQITAQDVDHLLPLLQPLGFQLVVSRPDLHFMQGYLPTSTIVAASKISGEGLLGITPLYKPQTGVGLVTSQADLTLEAQRLRATVPQGVDGTGIKVGVISDSYNNLGGAGSDIVNNDLPAGGVTVLKDLTSGGTDEGRAMLQLVHDVAPGAALGFATAFVSDADFAQQIRDLANPAKFGAQVIVDDVFYFNEPYYQDGIIAQAVDDVVVNRGVSYFALAGNLSSQAYESTSINFANTTIAGISGSPAFYYDFDPGAGVDVRQRVTIAQGQTIIFGLQWDQPFYTANGVTTDLNIFLLNATTGQVVGFANDSNLNNQTPLELMGFTNTTAQTQYDVVIQRFAGPNVGRLKYVNFGANNSGEITFAEFNTSSPTIIGHAAAVNALAVGASPFFDQRNPESFTSKGPSTILFSPTGTPITPQVRAKPDVIATDGTDTTFFGQDIDGNGFKNFFGTSAASPHAAAVGALVKQANPSFTPAQIYNRLKSTADPNIGGTPGDVNLVGAGLINAYRAIVGLPVPANQPVSDGFESGVLGSQWEVYNNRAGRTLVRNTGTPAAGANHLTMDGHLGGFVPSTFSEAILHVNAAGLTNVMLSFKQKEFNDADQAMPATFTGHGDFDGVSLSVDGVNWFRIVSLTGAASTNSYQTNNFNLSTIATANGLTLGADTRIKFQRFGVNSFFIPNEGFAFDDISVTGTSADTTPPQVTGQVPVAGATIATSNVNIDVTFSEPVVGVDATDMVLTGAAAAGAAVGTPTNTSGNTWRFPVSGLVNGALTVSLAPDPNDIEDAAGNDLSPRPTVWNYTVALALPPVLAGIEGTPLAYTENDPATLITATLLVSDADSANLTGATVAITANYVNGQDVLSFTDQLGITGNFNPATGILTLSGTTTPANYQTALRAVRYQNLSENPSTAARTVTFQVNDGTQLSNTQARNIAITAVNDAPTLAALEAGALTYTENDPATPLTATITVADVDSTNLTSATVAISVNYVNGQDVLSFANQLGITGIFDAVTGVLTLSGTTTVANYQTALRAVRYQNLSDNPSILSRTVAFRVNDGSATNNLSNTQTRTLNITAVNDAPALAGIEAGALAYTENDPATLLTATLAATDVDNPNLTGATVSITANYANGQDVLSFTDQLGITGNFNPATGVLTLTGTTTLANYQTALRAVRYQNTSDNPSTLARTVAFQVNDGSAANNLSNVATRTVNVAAVNDAPVLAGIETGALSYTENDPATALTATITIADVDSANLVSATVSISANYVNGQDVLSFTDQLGITGNFNPATGILTLTGTTTLANYQTALRAVRYQNTSENPSVLARTLSFQVNDGTAPSNSQTRTLNITAVNDPSVLAGIEAGNLTYNENDPPTIVTTSLTVSDVDNTNLTGATISISANYANGQDLLLFTDQLGITGSFNAGTGILTLTGTTTVANYQTALRTVRYQNTSVNPLTATRTVTFQVNDGGLPSNTAARNISIGSADDAPVLAGIEAGTLAYTENDAATALTATLAVTDPDSINLASATVSISANYVNGQDVLSFTDQLGITGNFNAGTGILTLTGTTTLANYQTALRAVRYQNTSDNPSTLARTMSFQVNDGTLFSNTLTRLVSVAAVNDAPVLAGIEPGALAFTENDAATFITATLTASDADSTNLTGATVGITANYSSGQDVLSFTDQLGITGNFNPATGVLTLTGTTTVANYQTALRAVRYQNTSENPSTLARTLSIQVNDGALPSNTATRTISIVAVNDAPVLAGIEGGGLVYALNDPPTPITSTITVSDIDSVNLASATVAITGNYANGQDVLSFTDQLGITGSFNAGTGILTLTGSSSVANYQTALRAVRYQNTSLTPSLLTRTVTFQVNDGGTGSNNQTRDISITTVNLAPVLSSLEPGALAYTENDAATILTNSLVVSDADTANLAGATVAITANYVNGQDLLSFTNQLGITGNFNPATGILTLSGFTTVANYQTALRAVRYQNTSENPSTLLRTVSFQVNDGASSNNLSNILTRNITVTEVNDAPTGVNDVLSSVAEDSGTRTISFASLLANDLKGPAAESGQSLTIIAVSSPVGGTVTIVGTNVLFTPTADFNGPASFTYTLQDNGTTGGVADPKTATASVSFTVTEVNDAPTGVNDVVNSAPEDAAPLTIPIAVLLSNDLKGPANESSQLLSIAAVNNAFGGQAAIVGSNILFVLNPNYHGPAGFTYTLQDDGTTNGVADPKTSTANVTFTVTEVNDAPTGVNDTLSSVAEDSATRTISFATLLANDLRGPADESGQSLTITAVSNPIGGTAVIVGTDILFTPAPDFFGTAGFDYTVQDNGTTNGLPDPKTATARVSFTITEVNDAPSGVNDTLANLSEDAPARATSFQSLLANDLKGPANEAGQLLTILSVGNAVGGTVSIVGSTVVFTPAPDYNGPAGFDYTLQDNGTTNGVADPKISTATVSFVITEVNDAPVGGNDNLSNIAEDSGTRTISSASLLVNDLAGPADEAGQTLTLTAVSNPVGGTVVIVGTDVLFTPAPDFNGVASFSYTIRDNGTTSGFADPKTATVSVSFLVTEVNDAPTGTNDTLSAVTEDSSARSIPVAALLANDLKGPANEASQTLSILGVSNPVGGTVALVGNELIFTPAADFNGVASFVYTVQDDGTTNGVADPKTSTAVVSFTITEVNDQPIAANDALSSVAEDSGLRFISPAALLANDAAGPANEASQTLTITSVGNAVGGIVSLMGNQVVFLLTTDFNGQASFTYTIQDNGTTNGSADPKTSTATVSFLVTEVNDAPTGVNDLLGSSTEDAAPRSISVASLLSNDLVGPANEASQTLSITAVSNAVGGTVALNGGTIVFTPAADFNGVASFVYTLQDDGTTNGVADPRTGTATVSFTITEINDTPIAVNDLLPSVAEDSGARTIRIASLLANDLAGPVNESGQTLTLIGVDNAIGGTVSLVGDDVVFVPAADFNGVASFTYSITDNGTTNGVADPRTAQPTVSFTITEVNDVPTGTNDALASVAEDSGQRIISFAALLANDSAGPANEAGQTLTIIFVDSVVGGSVILSGSNVLFTPAADYNGPASFVYWLEDDGTTDGVPNPKAATATVSFTITEVNDAPAGIDDVLANVAEDSGPQAVGISLLLSNDWTGPANEADQTLTLLAVSNPIGGTAVIVGNEVIFTPAPDYFGLASFTYTIQDDGTTNGVADPLTSSATASFTITEVNDAPTGVDDALSSIAEDSGPRTISSAALLGNDSTGPANEADQTLTILSVSNAVGGTVTLVNGDVVFTPAADFHGLASFTYRLRDDGTTNGVIDPKTATAVVTFTITEVNDAPTAEHDILAAVVEDGAPRSILVADLLANDSTGPTNESDQSLTILSVDSAFGGTVEQIGGTIVFTLTPDFNGTASFRYTIQDNGTTNGVADPLTSSAFVVFAVTEVNDAPTGIDDTLSSISEDSGPRTIGSAALLGNDSTGPANESNQTLTIIAVSNPLGGTVFLVGGNVIFTPTADYNGPASFTYTVEDNGTTNGVLAPFTATATVSFTITEVNDAPTGVDDTLSNIAEDAPAQLISTAELLANDVRGPDNEASQTLTIIGVSNAVGGTVLIDGGNIVFTPAADFNGLASFTYTVEDNGTTNGVADPKTSTATVSFTITEVNDAPTGVGDALSSIAEDSGPRTISSATLLGNDSAGPANESSQTLTIIGVSNAIGGTVALVNGDVIFTPTADFNGVASFTYTLQDNGTTNGVADPKTSTATVSFTITEVNDAPTGIDDALSSIAEDAGPRELTFAALLGNDLTGPANEFSQTLTITAVSNAIGGTVTLNGNTVIFTPAADFNGLASFTYTLQDNGTTNGVADPKTSTATVTFTITEVNDAPTGTNDVLTNIPEDTTLRVISAASLLANDSTGPANESSQTLRISAVGNAVGGSVVLNGDNVIFTPAADFNGVASFTYTLEDNGTTNGVADPRTATASVTFMITEVNDAPTGADDTLGNVAEDAAPSVISTAALLANDSRGPANEAGQTLTIISVGNAVGGTVALVNGDVIFTLTPDFNGLASFTYTVEDNGTTNGAADPKTSTATVSFTVTEVNDAPIGVDDALSSIAEDAAPITISFASLLANDSRGPANESGQTLTIRAVTGAVGGTATIVGTDVIFTPAADFNGLARFTYTVEDNGTTNGVADPKTSTATVTFVITEVNDAPTAVNDALSNIAEDAAPRTIGAATLLANDSTGPANEADQTLTIVSLGNAVGGTVVLDGDDVIFTLTPDFNGVASFTYSVADNGTTNGVADPKISTATVTFTVTEVNDPTVGMNDTLNAIAEDAAPQVLSFASLLANDVKGPANEAGQNLTITAVSNAVGGTVTIVGTDVIFTPTADFNGPASFTYTLMDDGTTNGVADPQSSSATVSFLIFEVNDAPTGVNDVLSTIAEDAAPRSISFASLLGNDSRGPANEANQTLTISAIQNVVGGIWAFNGDTIVFIPDADFNGAASFTYTVEDNGTTNGVADPKTSTATVSFTITEINDAPTGINDSLTSIAEDSAPRVLSVATLLANDLKGPANEAAQTLTITAVGNAIGGTVALVGNEVIFTPTADFNGVASFTYTLEDNGTTNGVADHKTSTATVTFSITEVNDGPTGVDDTLEDITEDAAPVVLSFATLVGNDAKGPANEAAQSLTITAVSNAVGGTVAIVGTTVVFTPAPDYNGPASFVYTVQDNGTTNGAADPKTSTATVRFTITAVNDAPTFTKGPNLTVLEDAGPQVSAAWATDSSAGPTDEVEQTLTYLVSNDNNALFAVQPTLSADGTLTWTPAPNANGSATVTVRLQDDGGTADGGVDTSVAQTFTISVTAVNDIPIRTAGALSNLTVDEDAAATLLGLGALAYAPGGGTDENGQNLTYLVTEVPAAALGAVLLADGTTAVTPGAYTLAQVRGMQFRPAANASGTATLRFTVKDEGGTANGGVDSLPQALTITVNRLDDDHGEFGFTVTSRSATEGTNLDLTVTRSNGSEGTVSVSYLVAIPTNLLLKHQATEGADFKDLLGGSVTFAPGETEKVISFAIESDKLVEVTENFTVTLQGATGGGVLGTQTVLAVAIQDVNLPIVPDATPTRSTLEAAGAGFGKSDEHYIDFVTKAYRRYLDRLPDAPGLTYWVTLMKLYESSKHTEGLRQEQIEAGFLHSEEYLSRFGGVGEAWIRGIYHDLLNREAEPEGLAYWKAQIAAGVAPTQIALGFTTSLERLQNRIKDTYLTLLEREAEPAGLAYWVAIFQNGGTTEDINSGFVGSPEYYAKATGAAGNPAKWVRDAYLDVLFRPARVDEMDYWLAFLKQ